MRNIKTISLLLCETFLLLVFAMLATSCQTSKESSFFDSYLLFAGKAGDAKTIMKLNVDNGSITALCSDPLCDHSANGDCLFRNIGISSLYIEDGQLYYSVEDIDNHTEKIMRYDVENATATDIYTFEATAMADGSYKSSRSFGFSCGYLWAAVTDPADMSVKSFRVRLSDKKYEELSEDNLQPIGEYNKDYLYTNYGDDGVCRGFFIGDKDGNSKKSFAGDKEIQIIFSDFIENDVILYVCPYKDESGKYIWESQTLYACNLKTGEEWTVLERFGDVYFLRSGDFIYYADLIEYPPAIGFDENDGKEAYNSTGGIIWRTNLYSGETEKFKELPEYRIIPTQTYLIGDKIVFGYENIDYSNYTVDNGWYNYDTVRGWLILSPEDGNATDIVNTADLYQN